MSCACNGTTLLDEIKCAANQAALAVATAFGDTGDYVSEDGTATVFLQAGGIDGDVTNILAVRSNRDMRTFWISTQTGFPPAAGPSAKHHIIYRGDKWAVKDVDNPDGIGLRYVIKCSFVTAMSLQK